MYVPCTHSFINKSLYTPAFLKIISAPEPSKCTTVITGSLSLTFYVFLFSSETARIQRKLTGSKISMSSTKFLFFGPIWKPRWPSRPQISRDILDFSYETTEQNSTKMNRKPDLKFVFFGLIRKPRWGPWLIHYQRWRTPVHNLLPFSPLVTG